MADERTAGSALWRRSQHRLGRPGDEPDGVEDAYFFQLAPQKHVERRKTDAMLYIGPDGSIVAVEVFAERLSPLKGE